MVIEVFDYRKGFVTLPDKPAQDDFVQVLTKSEGINAFADQGDVYIKRVFKLNFLSDYL